MRPTDEIEKLVKEMSFKAGPEVDNDLWTDAAKAHDESQSAERALSRPFLRRITMNVKMMRIAAVVVIALVILLPLSYGAVKVYRNYSIKRTGTIREEKIKAVNREEAQNILEQAKQLIKEGKTEEVRPGYVRAVLPDGT